MRRARHASARLRQRPANGAAVASLALAAVAIAALAAPPPGAGAPLRSAPVNITSPSISGKYRIGQTLTASQGEWNGSPNAFFYRWLRCDSTGSGCAPIASATEPTYLLGTPELGSRLRVEVVASNPDGSSPAARSAATPAIKVPVPVLVSKPEITGEAREGVTLAATPGAWTNSPTSYAYKWVRCAGRACAPIPGAQASSYAVSAADVGTRLRVRVRAANPGGDSRSAGSLTTPVVKGAAAGLKLARPSHDLKRGLARIVVTVPGRGSLELARTHKVRGQRRQVSAARAVKLTIRPRQAALRKLRRSGRARVRLAVNFTPETGAARTKTRHVVLKRKA